MAPIRISGPLAPGELAALAGFLSQVRPQVALTIGAMASGALAMIADQAAEVHAFEAGAIATHRDVPPNVEVHSGQRGVHGFLAAMSARGASIGLVFIDGGQVTETLPRTVESVLSSAAVDSGLVLVHGSANDAVRAGLEGVAYRGVAHVDLDCLAGRVQAQGPLAGELVGGLALMVVDSNGKRPRSAKSPHSATTRPSLCWHVLAFRLREYFQPLRWIRGPTSASMAFRLRAEIPATVLEDACRLEIVDELEIDDVYDYAESIVGAAAELRLIAARAMCFASHGLLALARETLERGAALERPLADWDFRTVARRHAPDLERTLAANDAAA